mmetsp:Transcript_22773/g.57511  ORF Transcript_22773/g.57511 Transcript_22773/m.57511 type:complete len:250 (-) Transcript_22773:377-1126(-)
MAGGSCSPCASKFSGRSAFSSPPSMRTRQRCLPPSHAMHMADRPLSSGCAHKPASRTEEPGRSANSKLSSLRSLSSPLPLSSETSQRCFSLSQFLQVASVPLSSLAACKPQILTGAPAQKRDVFSLLCNTRFSGRKNFSTPATLTSQRLFSTSQRTHVASWPFNSGLFCKPARLTSEPTTISPSLGGGGACAREDEDGVGAEAVCAECPPAAAAAAAAGSKSSSPSAPNWTVEARIPSLGWWLRSMPLG